MNIRVVHDDEGIGRTVRPPSPLPWGRAGSRPPALPAQASSSRKVDRSIAHLPPAEFERAAREVSAACVFATTSSPTASRGQSLTDSWPAARYPREETGWVRPRYPPYLAPVSVSPTVPPALRVATM
jgi:hypothetical protein